MGIKSNKHIICPVIAALHRAGDIKADADGDVELGDLYDALNIGLGFAGPVAHFQSYGIVVFDKDQKGKELSRHVCSPPSWCHAKRWIAGIVTESTKRWFNVFTMNGKQALEHGVSTGIRGGDTNMPPNAVNCNGIYPCEERFHQFFDGLGVDGRFYFEDMMRVVCRARKFGDRGGEHAYATASSLAGWDLGPVPHREWQMKGALKATVGAFGRTDSEGQLYLTTDDLRALFLEGRYPDGWQWRENGCLLSGCNISAIEGFNLDVPCDVGYDDPFWQGTGCEVNTGRTCGSIFSDGCQSGETCVADKCLCGRGESLRTMCFHGGACREQQEDSYSWFGGPRKIFAADNPTPPGNP